MDASVARRRRNLVSVESTDMFDNSALAVDCSDEEFRTIEASQYQVLLAQSNSKRTTESSATNTRTAGIREHGTP